MLRFGNIRIGHTLRTGNVFERMRIAWGTGHWAAGGRGDAAVMFHSQGRCRRHPAEITELESTFVVLRPQSHRVRCAPRAWRAFRDACVPSFRRWFSRSFLCKAFGVAKRLVTIQIEHDWQLGTHHHSLQRTASTVTRNRILLTRAIEEAEGYTELGMLEHALHALQRRGTLVHSNGRACFLLGEAFRELGRCEEALFPLERSADLMPDDIHVWLALGWCYKRTGQLAKAIDALERAVQIDSSEAVLHYNLACYWSLARNRSNALHHLSRALEIDANFRDMIPDEADFNPLRQDPEFIALTSAISNA